MTKVIVAGLCALVAAGCAIVGQGVGMDASVSTWAMCGAIGGLVLSFVIGA